MPKEPLIEDRIERASTLPSTVYTSSAVHETIVERVFATSWQLVHGLVAPTSPGDILPWTLLEGCLDEPLLTVMDEAGQLRHLSNVCTHRGNLLVNRPCTGRTIRCGYHGRRFGLDGKMLSMPEFEGAEGFPSPSDDLPRPSVGRWGPFDFLSLSPELPFDTLLEPLRSRLAAFPVDRLDRDDKSVRSYEVQANWALYCDNYLEGFHIPYVHEQLATTLDYGAYETECHGPVVLQIGIAKEGELFFDLPAGHPDAGRRVAAYYFWLFPNTMLNVYPWGISVNVVVPRGAGRTMVRFESWIWDAALRQSGAGGPLHQVELEDEAIVERVQRGVRSRLYDRGRFSPRREAGVHHFHRLLAQRLSQLEL